MNVLISETQSAFIPGHLITDNVFVAYEINHYLKRKTRGKEGHMALKLDLSKAFDHVEWQFLESILLKLGIHASFVSTIMTCVRTVLTMWS